MSEKEKDMLEEEMQEDNFITLEFEDEEGKESSVECEIMGVFESQGKEYIALLPDDGSEDVYIYAYIEVDDEEFEIQDITDDAEFEKAVADFDALMAEEE